MICSDRQAEQRLQLFGLMGLCFDLACIVRHVHRHAFQALLADWADDVSADWQSWRGACAGLAMCCVVARLGEESGRLHAVLQVAG